jgi:hypothetical protein
VDRRRKFPFEKEEAMTRDAVFQVDAGRGFKVGDFVITASHCLPHLPPCAPFIGADERTYPRLVGRLGEERTVSAELMFADPISDLAILGTPDDQERPEEATAYDQFLKGRGFTVADVEANTQVRAKILSLGGEWVSCRVSHRGGPLWVEGDVEGGMSGSPIVNEAGKAIGVLCSGNNGGPRPLAINCRLMHSLPRWFNKRGRRALLGFPQ